MEESAYIGLTVAGLVYFALGARLVWLGIRAGSNGERLLGLTFLIWGLSYVFWVIPIAIQAARDLESQFFIAAHITTNIGDIGFTFVPYLTFRRGSTWAKWLVAAIATFLVAGAAGSIWAGDAEGVDLIRNGWWWSEWIAHVTPSIWIGVEGLHHYGTSRRGVRLGLCEPIASHRYLLWGLAGVSWTLLELASIVQSFDFWAHRSWSTSFDILVGFFEVAALAMIWLAYFAPAAYQRKINASAVSA